MSKMEGNDADALAQLCHCPAFLPVRISEVLDTHFAKSWTSVSQSPGQLTRFGRECLVEFQAVMISALPPWVKRDGAQVLRMLSPSRAMR